MIAVVILAAGESRRMGHPKALLPFPEKSAIKIKSAKSETFLEHLMEVTRHKRVGALRVVVGAHAKEIGASAKLDADELVVNEDWRRGQLSSLQAAIRSLPEDAEGVLLCLVDHPLISAKLVAKLIETFDRTRQRIVIPTFRGRRGHPVIFPRAMLDELLDAPEEVGARAVVRAHTADVIEVPVEEEGVILNLNDPATLLRSANQIPNEN